MKYTLYCALILVLFPTFATTLPGKWCESADAGKTCNAYFSYFENGKVYAYGIIDDSFYIATGHWRQHNDQSCLTLTYKAFDILTEFPSSPDDQNICRTVLNQTASTLSLRTEDGRVENLYKISNKPDHSMTPRLSYLTNNTSDINPSLLALDVPPGRLGLYPLPLEKAPASVSFNLSLTPSSSDHQNSIAYAHVQIGDPDSDYLRVSLLQPETADNAVLLIEYIMPGYKTFRKSLASDIAPGERVLIQLAWQPDGTTTLSYKNQTVQYKLPLEQWQSYFMASNTKATFQRLAN